MVGRIAPINAAIGRVDVEPLVREMWRAARDEVKTLGHRMDAD